MMNTHTVIKFENCFSSSLTVGLSVPSVSETLFLWCLVSCKWYSFCNVTSTFTSYQEYLDLSKSCINLLKRQFYSMDYGTYASTRLPVLQKKSLCYFWYSLSTFKIMTVVKNLISRTHVGRAILDSPDLGRNKWDVLLCYNLQKEIYRFSDEIALLLENCRLSVLGSVNPSTLFTSWQIISS
jgi:hypothetical protein